MGAQNELLDAIQILIDKSMADRSTRITGGAVKSASGGLATVTINGYDYSIPYSGTAPTVGSTVRVFIPNGNMSDAFIGGGGSGGGSSTTNYNSLTNKPSINGVVLYGDQASKDLKLYGENNQPPYPVTSVNGQTGDVTIESGGVTSVNGKSGDVTLTKDDVGLGNVDNVKQYSASNPPPYPVSSVNNKTGVVVLTQDDVGNGTTYVRTHNDFTDAAKQQINTNEDNIAMLDSDIAAAQGDITTLKGNVTTLTNALGSKQDTIVGGASTITDDNLAANRAMVSDGNGKVAVSNVTSTELGYLDGVTSNVQTQLNKKLESAPVTSVNGKVGAVQLSAADVDAVATSDVTQTLGSSTTKVPSEKAVADALSGAGAGDMLKATYDPTGSVAQAGGIPDYVEANGGKVDTIKVNGTAQPITNKAVDIAVPTDNSQLNNGAGYITESQVPVKSVNGKTGVVDLSASDVGAVPTTRTVNGHALSSNVTVTKSDVGLGSVANERQYSTNNPPPYPVTSVNGQTGAVEIDVGGGGTTIVLSSSQPSGLKAGDYWYQIVT